MKKDNFFTIYERKNIIINKDTPYEESYEDDVFLLESTSLEEISQKLKSWNIADKTAKQLKSSISRGRNVLHSLHENTKILIFKNLGE